MTEHNIRVGWISTGLYPFNAARVIPSIETPSTPARSTPLLSHTPLASISSENRVFLQENESHLQTPVKIRLSSTTMALETAQARNMMLDKD